MTGSIVETAFALLAGAIIAGLIVWLVRSRQSTRDLDQQGDAFHVRLDSAEQDRNRLSAENITLKSSLQAERATIQKHQQAAGRSRTELESLREKGNTLTRNLFVLGAERDELNQQLSRNQNTLNASRRRVEELQEEFDKVGEFYKTQLAAAVDQREALERKIEAAKSEQDSLRNLLMASKAEHESVSNMLTTAQSRLDNLDALEQQVINLEAENAQLKHESTLARKEVESMQRDLAEMDALKTQNRELGHCIESMESSRKQYEEDARRYRDQYEKSEMDSETLRFKMSDIEKNISEMQKASEKARNFDDQQNSAIPAFGLNGPQGEIDNLTEIHGVGKVLEKTLHRLGIYHFRQIAAFGPGDVARVNAELKDFKGRIEHDDWINQAKELHYRKYGGEAD